MGALGDYFGAPLRILLLEDDPEITTEFTRTVDQSEGDIALVASTSNESEVPQLLQGIGVDCVFVDESLTRKSWTQVVHEILTASPAMRVVVFTEYPSEALMNECLRHGARRPIRKHLPLAQLLQQLESLVDDERRLKLSMAQFGGGDRPSAAASSGDRPRSGGRVVVVASGYAGGAGKTTAVTNMAVWMANHPVAPMRTALLDLEKGRGSVRVLFDPQMAPAPSILDMADWAGQPQVPPETLKAMIPKDTVPARKYHLTTVFGTGSFERDAEVTPQLVQTVITSLRLAHDLVLVDLPGDATDAAVEAMRLATTVLWFVRADIKDFERHADILGLLRHRCQIDTSKFQSVVSMLPPHARPPFSPAQIQKALGMRLMPWALPYDPKVAMALPNHFAAMEDRGGPYMTALRKVVEEIAPEMRAAPGAPRRQKGGLLASLLGRGGS